MIPFKDVTLADRDTITSFTMKSDRRNCDLSFSNLCSWRFLYDTQFAVVDNFLVFKFWAGEQLAYMMPVGTGDLKAVLWELIEDARKENLSTGSATLIRIMNIHRSLRTAFRNVWIWKQNGVK